MVNFFTRWVLLCCFLLSLSVGGQANLFGNKPQFLRAEQAFIFTAKQAQDRVELHWSIADGYYLYKKEIQVDGENVTVGSLNFPPSERYHDEFFGDVDIFRQQLALSVPVSGIGQNAVLTVTYQGCTKGFCYPPETQTVSLGQSVDTENRVMSNQGNDEFEKNPEKDTALLPEQDRLAQLLSQHIYTVFWFFLFGIGLAFTPCVLPMLPLLSAIVMGNHRPSTGRALALSFVYVQGMALTYTILGLTVAAIGLPFQVALQSPYVLVVLSIIFIALALSMFGVFTLQLPNSWQNKLTQISQQQKQGAFGGVFVMGMIAGLVASPCITAPLSGVLLYVAQSGDMIKGAVTLYLLALGMGLPLLLITVFGNRILPKSGAWLENVKIAFGFVMLAVPIFLLSRVLAFEWEPRLWALLGTSFFFWLAFQMHNYSKWGKFSRVLCLVMAVICAKPLQDWIWKSPSSEVSSQSVEHVSFQQVNSYEELQTQLAANPKKIAMLDLYADWCVACKEFEKYTFSDKQVQQAFNDVLLLQIDMTKNSEQNRELMQKLNVIGLPTIIFYDQSGKEIPRSRITGFLEATPFLQWIQRFLNDTL
ncbi:protein-disulfide reductase DsbD [Conservatibacter flavescens]|uniref:Thiol:disulfide interchange protein DsbD n=1 Tax=Conservatibacter flavescens TaxID=28161 RepID=A0A2M8S548_9PAST|nr:protein-disulfide reductase DsbD [Conservatibacter flavescens]PJG86266.1 protein-disulfide reductase DsbD [Conservatibacter flavescens]